MIVVGRVSRCSMEEAKTFSAQVVIFTFVFTSRLHGSNNVDLSAVKSGRNPMTQSIYSYSHNNSSVLTSTRQLLPRQKTYCIYHVAFPAISL